MQKLQQSDFLLLDLVNTFAQSWLGLKCKKQENIVSQILGCGERCYTVGVGGLRSRGEPARLKQVISEGKFAKCFLNILSLSLSSFLSLSL